MRRLAVIAQLTRGRCNRRIIRQDRAGIAEGAEILGWIKTGRSHLADGSTALRVDRCADGLRAVFYHAKSEVVLQSAELFEVERNSVKMNRNKITNRSVAPKEITALLQIDPAGVIHVGENRHAAGAENGKSSGKGRQRSREHLLARLHMQATQSDFHGIESV